MSDLRAPNLFIIGAPKCGTTSLHMILSQHPEIYMTQLKEPRFFTMDKRWNNGVNWYLNKYFRGAERFRVRGESTPTTLFWHAKTISRIQQCTAGSDPKFIAILRDPVDRAYSHYWYNVQTKMSNKEELTFEQALDAEAERSARTALIAAGVLSYSYVATGKYADQILAFQNAFGKQAVLVLMLEDLFEERFDQTIQRVESFLGVRPEVLPKLMDNASHRIKDKRSQKLLYWLKPLREVINPFVPKWVLKGLRGKYIDGNKEKFAYPPMDERTRQRLASEFEESNLKLGKLIGRDVSHWSKPNSDPNPQQPI